MNLFKTAVIILVLIAVSLVIIYFLGTFEQTKPIADTTTNMLTQGKDYVTNNLPTVICAAGTITAIGGMALSKINTARNKLTEVKNQADTQIQTLTQAKDNAIVQVTEIKDRYETQLKTLKDQTTDQITQAKTELQTTQASFTEIQQQKASLQNQVNELTEDLKKARAQLEVLTAATKIK